jgi:hypothetical protein
LAGVAARFEGLLPVEIIPGRDELVRIHHKDNGAVFFGPAPGKLPANRFDAPAGEYRVLYCARRLEGAFVETILRRPRRPITEGYVNERAATNLLPRRTLVLAKLYDEGLHYHGIDVAEIAIEDYAPSRTLALAFHAQFANLDGLAYRSRVNNGEICYALFDRVAAADLPAGPRTSLKDIPDRVKQLMDLHGAVFDRSPPIPVNPP